jgi:hypothetical protein
MALVTTFVSSPLTAFFYPPWYQKKVESWRRGEIDWDTGKPLDGSETPRNSVHYEKLAAEKIKRLTVYLRLDSMPNLLAFTSLFGGNADLPAPKTHPSKALTNSNKDSSIVESTSEVTSTNRPVEAYGLRLLNLTDRGSSVMQVSEIESYPVVNTFRTFGRLHNLAVSGEVLVVPEASFAETLSTRASDSDFLVLPWSETGGMSEQAVIEDKGTKNKLAASGYMGFVAQALEQSVVPVAVLINKNFGGSKNKDQKRGMKLTRTVSSVSLHSARDKDVTAPIADRSHHIFFPFLGGNDDRAALRLVLQLCENKQVTASIVMFEHNAESIVSVATGKAVEVTTTSEPDAAFFASLRASIPADMSSRVVFESIASASPVKDIIERARLEVGQAPKNAGDLVVLGRNIGRNAMLASHDDVDEIRGSNSAAGTLGVLAEKVWEGKVGASVLVVKAAY